MTGFAVSRAGSGSTLDEDGTPKRPAARYGIGRSMKVSEGDLRVPPAWKGDGRKRCSSERPSRPQTSFGDASTVASHTVAHNLASKAMSGESRDEDLYNEDWALEQSSDGFQDFVIPYILKELKRRVLASMSAAEAEAFQGDVVDAAELLTWGPLRLSFHPLKQLSSCGTEHDQADAASLFRSSSPVAVTSTEYASTCVCCPSVCIFNRLRGWMRRPSESAHAIMESCVSLHATPAFSEASEHGQAETTTLSGFGVLARSLGLLLFTANRTEGVCHLVCSAKLNAPGLMRAASSNQKRAVEVFFPKSPLLVEGGNGQWTRVDSLTMDFGLARYRDNWVQLLTTDGNTNLIMEISVME